MGRVVNRECAGQKRLLRIVEAILLALRPPLSTVMLPTMTSDAPAELQRSRSTSSIETIHTPSKKDSETYFDQEKVDVDEVPYGDDDSDVKVIEKAEEVAIQVCALSLRLSVLLCTLTHTTF